MSGMREKSLFNKVKLTIKNHPIFSKLDERSLNELLNMTELTHAYPNEAIVNEGDPIDAVYLIIEGKAEVRTHANSDLPIAILSDYDAIGLTATGLYSQTGMRTATVIALTKIVLLKLKLEYFYRLTERFASTASQKRKLSDQILKVQFLKQVIPFANLSMEKLEWLTHRVDEVQMEKGEYVFHEGDDADECFLIFKGEVEVLMKDKTQEAHRITTLHSPMIFGETAPLLNKKRNASVRTLSECDFLVIKRQDLLQLFQFDKETSKILNFIVRQRSRPKRHAHVITYEHHDIDGGKKTIIKDPVKLNFYQLTEESKFIWLLLNGENSLYDITFAYYQKYKVFDPNMICNIIVDLVRAGFVDIPAYEIMETTEHLPFWKRLWVRLHQFADAQITFTNVDGWFTKTYQNIFHIFFNRFAFSIMLLLSIFGIAGFALLSPTAIAHFHQLSHPWLFFIGVIALLIVSIPAHELAHAFTTKYFKHQVSVFGIGLHWFIPTAFTDPSDMWASDRKPRLMVSFAGILADLSLAGISALIAWFASNPGVISFFWLFALVTYVSVFKNFNPIQEFDGYTLMSDSFNKVHWRESAFQWAVKSFPAKFFSKEAFNKFRAELVFWIFCLGYFVIMAYGVFFLQQVLLPALVPESIANFFTQSYRWLLPSIAVVLVYSSLWVKLNHTPVSRH